MKFKTFLMALFVVASLVFSACSKSASSSNTANTTKPTEAARKPDTRQPTTALQSEKDKRPQNAKGLPTDKKVPVPDDWIYLADEVKGYGFWLPSGSTGDSATSDGVDSFVAKTPAPSEISVIVYAWKDKSLTKQDLLDRAVAALTAMGTKVTPGTLVGESDDYALADATSVDPDGSKFKMKILVATDVTDNYVMVVYTEESKFVANEKIIDEIWGNFEMYSGGASGN